MIRFVLEEVLEDLHKAEAELPLRKIRGTIVLSGGPRVGRGKTARYDGAVQRNTIGLAADEAEARFGTPIAREKILKERQTGHL